MAGSIGARDLAVSAAELEQCLRRGDDVQYAMEVFDTALRVVMAGLGRLSESRPEPPAPVPDHGEPPPAGPILERLSALLRDGDSDAQELLPALDSAVRDPDLKPSLARLHLQVQGFDFDEALETLNELAAALGSNR